MNQPTLLQRAKQGDDVAIAAVLNYLLKDRNITAKVAIKGDSLLVLLKSVQLPQQESSVAIVDKLMNQLNVESIKIVEVYGKQIGQKSTAWSESLDLMKITKSTKKLNRFEKLSDTGKLKTNEEIASSVPNTNRWPLWFPYPSSWIRALILIPMAFPGARLILSGFGGIILSVIGKDLTLLIFFSLFCILLPTIFIAFIYHFFWFIWKKKIETKKLLWWLPGTKSWRESFYGVFVIGLSFTIILIFVAGFAFLFCKLSHETGVEVARCAGSALGKVANGMFCSIDRFFDSNDSSNIVNDRDNIDIPLWFGLWLIIASYLYQAEYLMRHDIFPKLKGGLVKYPFLNNLIGRNPQKFFKNTVIILLIPLVAVGIYFGSKLPQLNGVNPSLPVASQSPLPKPSPIIESSPIQSPSPISSPQADVFREAVNKAISAAQLTQSAKSKAQWNQVANEWESAIAFMETVPESSPNYAIAQKKAIEYQENLDYAKRAANLAN